jgi:hypothetical protein
MSSDEAAFIEPALLSDRLSRNTKGLMISVALILVSATVSVIGTLQDESIVMIIGVVIASIFAVAFFIFFLLNLLSIKKLGRTEEQLVPLVNKIYISLFSAFFLSLTGAANSYGSLHYFPVGYFVSRITGMFAIAAFLLFFLYTENTQLPPADYEEKLKSDTLLLILSLSLSALLSIILVLSYLMIYENNRFYVKRIVSSVTPIIGVLLIIFFISLVIISIKYQKFANLSHNTSNYGIIIIISLIIGFAVIVTGFFYNSAVFNRYSFMGDGQLISRILIIIGLCIFSLGVLFVNMVINNLKSINKKLRKNWANSIFPLVSFSSAIILVIETIVRRTMWNNFDPLHEEHFYATIGRFVVETMWSGYIFTVLFTIVLAAIIYGFVQIEREILIVVPNYGKIPVKIKKSKIQVQQPAVYLPPKVAEEVPEDVRETIERGTKCKKCGVKLLKRYRFCPDCGVKFQEEATKALPKATYCVMCGEKLSEKYRFCPTCGSMLE